MTFIAGALRAAGDSHSVCKRMFEVYDSAIPAPSFLSPSPDLAFGISLSKFLPQDIFDRQPLQQARYLLVGDVRIDNRDELSGLLGLVPAQSSEMADSDLFLAAWLKWQKGCVDHVIGGFAVAVWDSQERELCLLRDHSGERPLHYAAAAGTFAFASMPRALRSLPGLDTSLNEEQLLHYLAIGPDCTDTSFFRNISILQPGRMLSVRDRVVRVTQYWHPIHAPAIRLRSNAEYEEALLERFDAAVKARMRTTGKVGTQLSGGMDSSSVTAAAARLLNDGRLTAFTAVPQAGFADRNQTGRFGDEGPAAAMVAAMYPNIDHVLVDASDVDLMQVIEQTGNCMDMPVFNPTNQMWLNAILEQARARGIGVLLQGVCGNATVSFGGLIGLSDLFRKGHWLTLASQVRELRAKGYTSWRGAAYSALGPALPLALRRFLDRQASQFDFAFSPVHPERAREHGLRERAFKEFFASHNSSEAFRRKVFDYYDAGFVNGAASLGWQVSLRDPMQDKRIFEFCFAIPIEQYLAEGQTRSLVRRAMRDRLPAATLACTTRGLQAADWFLTLGARQAQMAEELKQIATSPTAQRLLDVDRLQRLLETWPSSGYERQDVYDSWHLALARGLAAGNFIRHHES